MQGVIKLPRPAIAIDIETVGLGWENLESKTQDYLLNRAKTEDQREKVPKQLGLNPGTGKIIAIAMWRPDQGEGGVLIEEKDNQPKEEWGQYKEDSMIFRGSEEEILQEFWRYISKWVVRIVTFNGRSFDGPFLMLRSAILGLKPTRNLLTYRYSFKKHCDLAEVVSFHRARQLESLDFWCRRTGLKSPKQDMEGKDVQKVYKEGNICKIANYCLEDAKATARLYKVLEPVIKLME